MGRFELMLMRHGAAEDFAEGGDAQRALTGRGHAMARRVGALMRTLAWDPTIAVSSPFVRARQTLQGVLEAVGAPLTMETEPGLVPGAPAGHAVATLIERATVLDGAEVRMLAVGHNPCVTGMLAQLVRGDERMAFAVSTGDVAHLSVDPNEGAAVVLSYMPAGVLERLSPP
ncbi:MAG: histidine phosphatase family protein [Nannocystaceae bacterium]|nr:histidine phosphatase family protein [Nannocystaceae bacterium]